MPRTKTPIWQSISTALTKEIAEGAYGSGDKLPTEAALSARFGVNRHTVRRALAALADAGLVHARRGAGVFVASAPTDYPIGRRVRFHQNLRAAGRMPAKIVLSSETRQARWPEVEALRLDENEQVHVYEGLSLADNHPIAIFRSVFPAAPFPSLINHLRDGGSVTDALKRCGVADYTRASTRITAKQATAAQAVHLRVAEGAPILRTQSVNVDQTGRLIEYGHTWFAGDRVTLTLSDI